MGGNPKSLSIPDARGNQACLRVTRHPAERKIVVSHWRQGLCVASTPVELSEVPALIGVLAAALGDAVAPESVASNPSNPSAPSASAGSASARSASAGSASVGSASVGRSVRAPGSVRSALVSMHDRAVGSPWWVAPERFIRRFIRPTLAEVTVLRDVRDRPRGSVEHGRPSDDDRPFDDDRPASP